jgi:hypothetical protein
VGGGGHTATKEKMETCTCVKLLNCNAVSRLSNFLQQYIPKYLS